MSYNNKYTHRGGGYGGSRDKRYRPPRLREYDESGYRSPYGGSGYNANGASGPNGKVSSADSDLPYSNGHSSRHNQDGSRHSGHSTPSQLSLPESAGSKTAKSRPVSAKPDSTPEYNGTLKSGVNPNDAKFPKLLHHSDFRLTTTRAPDPSKNYKVLYDPDLDTTLSKAERKAKSRKLRYSGEHVSSSEVTDPRKANIAAYFQKPNKRSKKFPFKQLPQPKFAFDKDSLGPAPQTELVVWDLPSTTSEVYLTNYFKSYGDPIKDMKFINDPINAVPLGIATFKFQGNPEKAMKLARTLIQKLKGEHAKIDGVDLKIGLNDNDSELLQKRIDSANEKLRVVKVKRAEEEKRRLKRQLEEEQKRKEVEKKQAEEQKAKEEAEKKAALAAKPKLSKFSPNTTTVSIRHNNKVIPGVFLPSDLKKYIKDRPYILIHDRYVSTKRIPSSDIKRALNKYDWTRVLSDKTGFYIVFNSLRECERCFFNEDGRKFYEYRMYMELAVPEGYSSRPSSEEDEFQLKAKKNDLVDEAVNMLVKELHTFLAKDIRERIIAPTVLDLLSHDKYPEIVEDLKAKEAAAKSQTSTSQVSITGELKQNALSLLAKQRKQKIQNPLPSFKRKIENHHKPRVPKKNLIPMQHALNFDRESSDDEDEDEDEEDSSRSVTPVGVKRDRSSALTSPDDELDQLTKKHKKTGLRKSFLYESDSEREVSEEPDREILPGPEQVKQEIKPELEADLDEIDYSNMEERFHPTEVKPHTVFPEVHVSPTDVFDLDALQSLIKDEEDLKFANKVLEQTQPDTINNMDYWAWKQKDLKNSTEEIAEDIDLIEELDSRLECSTGSFRSEGYRQIPDADKIEYLPHRRKVHKPIKTVQHEDDDDEEPSTTTATANGGASGTSNNAAAQSSRVNRAKNRRFAADITAQIGSETEVLSLNALTKRKKPVSFQRSAIHNWGLYALEPIAAREMIIEYVGESIRQQVAEHREKSYLKTGIGSSYLFRVDENTVIDATKKGGIARFINHCCDPSCTAKIIKVEGKKRIVIYALRDIDANEELTYDYKFEREINDEERIRCLCGSPSCKGWLN